MVGPEDTILSDRNIGVLGVRVRVPPASQTVEQHHHEDVTRLGGVIEGCVTASRQATHEGGEVLGRVKVASTLAAVAAGTAAAAAVVVWAPLTQCP